MAAYFPLTVAVICALIYWGRYSGADTPSTLGSTVKTLSTAALALAGIALGAPWWVIIGLALGSLGDLCLSRPSTQVFLAGMAAFALGHLAYAVGFAGLWADGLNSGFMPVAVGMGAVLIWAVLWLAPHAKDLAWPVRGYAVIITLMVLSAAQLAPGPGVLIIQIGTGLFAVSDLVLSYELFVIKSERAKFWASKLLWPLYWGGQAMILTGAVMAL